MRNVLPRVVAVPRVHLTTPAMQAGRAPAERSAFSARFYADQGASPVRAAASASRGVLATPAVEAAAKAGGAQGVTIERGRTGVHCTFEFCP